MLDSAPQELPGYRTLFYCFLASVAVTTLGWCLELFAHIRVIVVLLAPGLMLALPLVLVVRNFLDYSWLRQNIWSFLLVLGTALNVLIMTWFFYLVTRLIRGNRTEPSLSLSETRR
jgi:hypothetical protein